MSPSVETFNDEPAYPPIPSRPPEPAKGGGERTAPEEDRVKLADRKARTIQHMMSTTFLAPGRDADVRAAVHKNALRGLRSSSKTAELRALWNSDTRRKLLESLAEKGFQEDQLAGCRRSSTRRTTTFDVLAHVAYALPPETREQRAALREAIRSRFDSKQQAFLSSSSPTTLRSALRNSTGRSSHRSCGCGTTTPSRTPLQALGRPRRSGRCSPASSGSCTSRLQPRCAGAPSA